MNKTLLILSLGVLFVGLRENTVAALAGLSAGVSLVQAISR